MNDLILHPSVACEPAEAEKIVEQGFWAKLRRTAGRIPFADEAVAAYYCAIDPKSPAKVKASLFGALAYFVVPADLIPDFIAGLGYSDDAAVLFGVIKIVGAHIKRDHKARAAEVLMKPAPPAGTEAKSED